MILFKTKYFAPKSHFVINRQSDYKTSIFSADKLFRTVDHFLDLKIRLISRLSDDTI